MANPARPMGRMEDVDVDVSDSDESMGVGDSPCVRAIFASWVATNASISSIGVGVMSSPVPAGSSVPLS